MRPRKVTVGSRRGPGLSLALALVLAAIPLQRLSSAVQDPVRSGAGMSTTAPLLLESGARLGVPGSAASIARGAMLAPRPWRAVPGRDLRMGVSALLAASTSGVVRLIELGRLQLEGG